MGTINSFNPTTGSENYICESMGYERYNSSKHWNIMARDDFDNIKKVYNVDCQSSTKCAYDTTYYCRYGSYEYYAYTYLSCLGCKSNFYISEKLCLPCPVGSTSTVNSTKCDCTSNWYMSTDHEHCFKCPPNSTSSSGSTFCDCLPGYYFHMLDSQEARCKICPPNSYSVHGSLNCSSCPSGSTSSAGSEMCECKGGLYLEKEVCKGCSVGFYSYSGAAECSRCPGNLTSSKFQSFCSCPPGSYWGARKRDCVECPKNTYIDSSNTTQCKQCPIHSTSAPGSSTCSCNAGYKLVKTTNTSASTRTGTASIRCEVCPENYFSTAGFLNCTKCPQFTTAKPASGECYR